ETPGESDAPSTLIPAGLVGLGRLSSAAIPTAQRVLHRGTPPTARGLCRRWPDRRPWRAGAVLPLPRRLQVAELSRLARQAVEAPTGTGRRLYRLEAAAGRGTG